MSRTTEKVTTGFLIALGLISMAISILDLFVMGFETLPVLKDTSQITLLLVGLLCFAIGLERLTRFESFDWKLDELMRRLESAVSAQVVEGYDAIYDVAIEFVQDAKGVVRATSFGEAETTTSQKYLDALARKLKQSRKRRETTEYRVIFGYGDPKLSSSRISQLQQRKRTFEAAGVGDQVKHRYVRIPWGLDVLIVDGRHLLIAFPTLVADHALRKGIKFFVDAPDLVESIRAWYDDYMWSHAETQPPSQLVR